MRLNRRSLTLLLTVIFLACLVTGCGPSRPSTIPVAGTVTLDGTAVEGASVMLMPAGEGQAATGVTDAEGKFTLKTYEPGDGARPGSYKVIVTKKEVTGVLADKDGLSGGIAPEGIQEKWFTPQKYSSPDTSGLTAEVNDGMEPLKLELTSP